MKHYYIMSPLKKSFYGLSNCIKYHFFFTILLIIGASFLGNSQNVNRNRMVTTMKKKLLLFVIALSIFSLANAQVIDLIGKGVRGETFSNLPMTEVGTIDHVEVFAIYDGRFNSPFDPSAVTFSGSLETPVTSFNTDIINKSVVPDPINGAYYKATFNNIDDAGVNIAISDTYSTYIQSFYAFVYRNVPEATYKSFISPEIGFVYQNGSLDPIVYNIPIETASASRNVTVKIPITELDQTTRKLVVNIAAGSVTKYVEIESYNLGDSFFLGEYLLENVPGNVSNISVSFYSPGANEGSGDSAYINGVVADVDIVKPIELEVCVKDIGNGLFSATFGYYNPNDFTVTLVEGSSLINHNTGSETAYEQNGILTFQPGTVENVFSRQFMMDEDVEWTVQSSDNQNSTVQASQNSDICPVEKGGVIFPLYDQGDGKTEVVLGLDLNALAAGNAGLVPSPLIYQIKDNKVLVEVIPKEGQLQAVLLLLENDYDLLYNTDPSLTDFIISPAQIEADGLSTIDVYFPISSLLDLNNFLQEINFVRVLSPTVNNAGIVTSQGDGAQRSDIVRESFRIVRDGEVAPVDGTGIKIGVMSDSYNTQPFTEKSKAQVDVENGDLPGLLNPNGYLSEVEVLKEFPFVGGFDEGRAMLQIVHDVAPGAALAFHTGVVSPRDFELGLKALQIAGCTVIVDDITFPAEPFFGQGKIAQAIQDFTSIPGNSYITSAGNFSDNGYQKIFNASTDVPQTNFLPEGTSQKAHVFGSNPDGSQDIIQKISVVPGVYMLVLQWDEDLASQENSSGAADDLDFYLVDDEGRLIVGNNRINDQGDPTEIMFFQATGNGEANIMITNASANPTPNLPFRFIAFRSTGLEFLEYAGAPTVSGHAMTPEAITIGAVFYQDAQNPESQFFSSKAGNLSDSSSTEVDISAPDGVYTNVGSIGQKIDNDDDFTSFFGTSAAAPHVAGAMALLQSAKVSWYPSGLPISDLDLYQQTATTFGSTEIAGAGLINVNNAFKQIATQTAKLLELVPEEGKIPSADYFEVTIKGKFFPESETVTVNEQELPSVKVLFDGVEIDTITLVSSTEIRARIAPFVGNPPLIVNSTAISPGGTDGGDSDPIYFFDGKIALNVKADDIDVLFGDDVEMSFSVEGLEDGVTFESLGLPPIVFTSPAVFPFPDVNNYIITPKFETPLTDEQLDLYQINFLNGILAVTKRDLLIKPEDASYTYGEAITINLNYEYNTNGITDNDAFLMAIEDAHQTDFYPENTLALVNRFKAIVNDYDILDLLNSGSWISSERTIQNRFKAIVNGMNVIDIEMENFTDYIDAKADGTTNRFKAIVNRFKAIVNSEDLFNNLVDMSIENRFKAIVNSSGLGGDDDLNEYSSVFAIIDLEDAPTDDEPDRSISKLYSLNLITGLDVTTNSESHYIFPGGFLNSIAANFNNFYDAGRISINPATLRASISDISIDKGEPVDLSNIIVDITGFVFDETVETVFPDGIPYKFIDANGHEYEIGDVGVFYISITDPLNYLIEYDLDAKLTVTKPLEYCGNNNNKVFICHNGNTICVSINAIQAHINHGDSLGQCESGNEAEDDESSFEEDSKFKLYPNPVANTLTIKNKKSSEGDIFIYDMYGNLYAQGKLKKNDSIETTFSMISFPDGIYIIRIISKKDVRTYNIVKN